MRVYMNERDCAAVNELKDVVDRINDPNLGEDFFKLHVDDFYPNVHLRDYFFFDDVTESK